MTRYRLRTCVCILLMPVGMLAWANAVVAQNAGAPLSTTKVIALTVAIAPGDLLDISVFDLPELAQQVRVGGDGKAQLALIGNTPVAGLTEQQAAEMIAGE